MDQLGRGLIGFGIIFVAIGLVLVYGTRFLPLGRLPGDFAIEKENFKFYFPLASSLIVSLIISGIIYLFRMIKGS